MITNILRTASVYIAIFIVFTLIYILLFSTPLLEGMILFYRGFALAIISGLICVAVLLVAKIVMYRTADFFHLLSFERILVSSVVAASINFCFFVIVPVTLDRSVTTFLLSRMAGSACSVNGCSAEMLKQILIDEYVTEFDAIGRRMNEQIASGNIKRLYDGSYTLTDQGERFLNFARGVSSIYNVQQTYVQESGPNDVAGINVRDRR